MRLVATMTTRNQTNFTVASVILLGLLIEFLNKKFLSPATNFQEYYFYSTVIRLTLMAGCYYAVKYLLQLPVIYLRGCVLLIGYMTFNLTAIMLNAAYLLDTANYWLLSPYRTTYFAYGYRLYEILTLVATGGGFVRFILLSIRNYRGRFCAMVTGTSHNVKGNSIWASRRRNRKNT